MKKLFLITLASVASFSICFGKNYKITEEDAAFEEAKTKGKAIAYIIG